jgi:DNA polymerase
MNSDVRDELGAWLEFHRDLGIEDFYSRVPGSDSALVTPEATAKTQQQSGAPTPGARPFLNETKALSDTGLLSSLPSSVIDVTDRTGWAEPVLSQGSPAHALSLFEAPAPVRAGRETLEQILQHLGDCQRCKLAAGRRNIVFGQGNPKAELVFVGEGPGADEDEQGLPFVGRAGQLLNRMLQFVGIKREDVYICNVVKCRPPGNRTPEPDEIASCSPFLFRQIEAISPRLVCCLGAPAVKTVLGLKEGILKIRGKFHAFGRCKALATVHPAYVLRNPREEKLLREDFEKIRAFLATPR